MVKRLFVATLLLSIMLMTFGVQAFHSTVQTVTVTARYLNVRQGPSTSTTILAMVQKGETYPVIGQSGTWWQIQVGNIGGYVSGRYVKVNASGAVAPTPVVNVPSGAQCPATLFWGGPTDGICPGAVVNTQAAFQSYQHGFMVWLADSGDIWVFINANAGSQAPWMHVRQGDYVGFPDATGSAPAGLVQPINGFGRVWANYHGFNQAKLKDELGWATASEVGYSATWQFYGRTSHVHTYISLADGRVVDAYSGLAGLFWVVVK